MKNRFFSIMLVVLFLFNLVGMTFNASANSENNVWHTLSDGSKIIYFKDGSTLTITAPEVVSTESNNIVTRQTKTMQVSASKKDSDDEYEWIYTLYCTFSYEYGVSSVCIQTLIMIKLSIKVTGLSQTAQQIFPATAGPVQVFMKRNFFLSLFKA